MCKLCETTEKTWIGDNRNCAFDEDGYFTTDNWNCATMSILRELSTKDNIVNFNHRDDNSAGSIGIVMIPDNLEFHGYLIMNWYKNRGRCNSAIIIDEESHQQLTEEMTIEIINSYK